MHLLLLGGSPDFYILFFFDDFVYTVKHASIGVDFVSLLLDKD